MIDIKPPLHPRVISRPPPWRDPKIYELVCAIALILFAIIITFVLMQILPSD